MTSYLEYNDQIILLREVYLRLYGRLKRNRNRVTRVSKNEDAMKEIKLASTA